MQKKISSKILSIGLLVLIGSIFLMPYSANAQTDQRCWKKEECEVFETPAGAKGVFFGPNNETEEACGAKAFAGKEVGFCRAIGDIETAISYGDVKKFTNVGEFIKLAYRYGFWIATILAVMVILISGIRWIISAGSSEVITSAKKSIGGALIGLVLLSLSYTILNIMNPYLVNLRMPQAWLIHKVDVAPSMCSEVESPLKIKHIGAVGKEVPAAYLQDAMKSPYKTEPLDSKCGQKYLVEGSGSMTCAGVSCPGEGSTCSPKYMSQGKLVDFPKCVKGQLVIHYRIGSLKQEVLQHIPYSVTADEVEKDWLDAAATGGLIKTIIGVSPQSSPSTFVGVCKNESENYLIIAGVKLKPTSGWEQWDGGDEEYVKINQIYKAGALPEYLGQYGGLGIGNRGESHWDCPANTKLVGFFLKNEIGIDWDPIDDGNLIIGQEGVGTKAVGGSWDQLNINDYISLERLKTTGVFLNMTVTQEMISSIVKTEDSFPPKGYKGDITEDK